MSAASNAIADDARFSDARFFGHPMGLMTLFFTELWERFSYYGMRALLVLYMVAKPENGGMGYDTKKAALIYGTYTSAVYLLSMPGGWAADKFLGGRLAVLIGGVIIALGHFTLAVESEAFFFTGLVLIVLGTGLLKPNISAMVGTLYRQGDVRRDAGFSIFYMGINIGAFVAPLTCGFLAQSDAWRGFLTARGMNPNSSWHWGFAAAGVGMTLGLVQYFIGRKYMKDIGDKPRAKDGSTPGTLTGFLSYLLVAGSLFAVLAALQKGYNFVAGFGSIPGYGYIALVLGIAIALIWQFFLKDFPAPELKRMGAIIFFFAVSVAFWALFEQAGSSLNLFADKLTDCSIFGWKFPSSYFQSVNSMFIILLAPLFSLIWIKWGNNQPSSPAKFAAGVFMVALGFVLAVVALSVAGASKVGPMWLVGVYFIHTVAELCLSPVGLSTMTKLAPERLGGLVMGIWFLGPTFGNYIGGLVAGHFDESNPGSVGTLFWQVALTGIAVAVVAAVLTPFIKKLMGDVK